MAWPGLVLAAALPWLSGTAAAEWPLGDSVTLGLDAGLGAFATHGANFGTGRVDLRTGAARAEARWQEAYLEPRLAFETAAGPAGAWFGAVSAVGAATLGDGDVAGFTNDGDRRLGLEQLYFGWRSGAAGTGDQQPGTVELSFGRQDVQLGDGFLIWDGNLDQFGKAAYWLAPRTAFRHSALLHLAYAPLRVDLFYLGSDRDQDEAELGGFNLEYAPTGTGTGTLGLLYFQVLDAAAPTVWGPREGMEVWSLRLAEASVAALPDLTLWGQYVRQTGSGRDARFDASAWYVELRYCLCGLAWAPSLSYRYARFSGDPDAGDAVREDFDPFFYGWSRGWGTWYQGEVTGEYLLFNSNQRNQVWHLAAQPTDALSIGAIFYRFALDQPDYFGTAVSARGFVDEVNLYLDWSLDDHWSVSAVYAHARPRTAARQAFGDNDTFRVFELAVYMSF